MIWHMICLGLLLYNGQYEGSSGDFISFGLRNARAEFRFDVGSSRVTILSSESLALNTWHTARFRKDGKEGMLNLIYFAIKLN